jgi:hypothetical protein
MCHIRAKSVGGPRYLESQTDEERHSFDNLILMCRNHHKEIDTAANLDTYTVEWLLQTKRAHEDEGRRSGELDAPANVFTALAFSASIYEAGATHLDLRGSTFNVGGQGGSPASPGGPGGVLIINGIASLPRDIEAEMNIELNGGNGQFPGGGSGGGGVLQFTGRPATGDDSAAGLRVPLFFPTDSATVANGLIFAQGAGWAYFWVPEFPCSTTKFIAAMIEFGSIDPNVLLGFEFTMTDPEGLVHVVTTTSTTDVAVPEPTGLVNRANTVIAFNFTFRTPGMYELTMLSGDFRLAQYSFEVRLAE